MSNIKLSKQQQTEINQAYKTSSKNYGSDLNQPIKQKTISDEFHENHSYKIGTILILAGLTYMILKNHQANEPPIGDFITSE
jgi:hypothetical protein